MRGKSIIRRVIKKLYKKGWLRFLPTCIYLPLIYFERNGQWLNLVHPVLFTEKMNWLKIHDQNPRYSSLVDKYSVKELVGKMIGDEYVVPCFGVWDKFEDVTFEKLPDVFVLKATHDSSGAYVCKNKNDLDFVRLKEIFDHKLSVNWYDFNREWPYLNVKPRIISEMYLNDGRASELQDYKFLCFNGEPKIMYITNKGNEIFENYYDMEFLPVDVTRGFSRQSPEFSKPKSFDKMKSLARQLSSELPFVRIDFYEVNGQVFFGEYTFYDWGGMAPFTSIKWETILGSWISLQYNHKMGKRCV